MTQPQINLPDMCQKHQSLLVQQARYSPAHPWRALIIASQVALFQAATADKKVQQETGGDLANLVKLGCLACRKPDAFGEIVEAAKSHDLGRIKALGEKWITDAASANPPGKAATTEKVKLDAMLHRERDGTFSMYFCRGAGKCTKTGPERKKLSRKGRVCPDCVKGDDTETLEHLVQRINRGDA